MNYLMRYLKTAKQMAIINAFSKIEAFVDVSVSILYKNGTDLNFKNSEKLGMLNKIDNSNTAKTSKELKMYSLIFS